MNKTYTPIQIIGTQRSGSNLLRLMINELQGVVAPHPPHILKTFMPMMNQYGDLSVDEKFSQLVDDVCRLVETNPVVWEKVNLDREQIFRSAKQRSLVEVFIQVYEQMASANEADFWCCKSMANVKYVDQMERHGLNPLFIRLVRDGRDVAASFKKVAVGEKHIYHLATYWKELQEKSEKLVNRLGSGRALTIKYEDLIEKPEEVMSLVCAFLGIPYSNQIFNYFKSEESKHTAASGYMWANVTQPILKNNTQKYKAILTTEEVSIFESIAGQMLEKNGYAVSHCEPQDFSIDQVEAFDIENEKLKRSTLQQEHLKVDLQKRAVQEALVEEIKARKMALTPEFV
ncbi:sulfotransferase family protein [Reichenbachiella sp.]|uniref:sulfotransferase family protein n=1 Tax=Reichenbachiella sp. TaxID=2184521 RepID=UPI003B59AABF